MKNLKTKFEENHKFIVILFLLILLTLISIIFVYNYKLKINIKESNTFDHIVNELNTINNSIEDYSTEFTIDNKNIITTLKNNIDNLERVKNNLRAFVIVDDYDRETSSKILSSIESAQNLYNCCISSLEYQNISSISDYVTKIKEHQFDLLKSYVDLNYLGIELSLTDDSLIFLDKLINYLNNLDTIVKKSNVKISQSESFIKSFKIAVSDLSQLAENLEPAISKVREDNRSFDSILKDLDDKESKYLDIKSNINSISIPEGYLSYYTSLIDTCNLYSNYLKTLRVAIIFEKSSTNYEDNKESIDKNFKNAFSKLDDVYDSLKSLEKSSENF